MIAIEKEIQPRHRGPRGNKTIVCVDDEPLVSRALYRLFSHEPYDVLIADTAKKALRYVQDYDVDLVITDQRMPDMSGVELLREVRQSSPATNGIILTAYPESVMVDDPPDAPLPPLFSKPWDDETLREGVRQLLREAPEAAPQQEVGVRTVLVPVDGSIEPEWTLGSLLPLLKRDPIKIVLLQVLPDLGLHRDAYAYLERTRARLATEGVEVSADVRWGDPARQILLHARHAGAHVIVLFGGEKRGWAQLFRRSMAEKILDETEVPLLIGRPDLTPRSWKRILVPLDGSREAEAALPEAVRLAGATGAGIDLVGVTPRFIPVVDGFIPYVPRVSDRTPYLVEVARHIDFQEIPVEFRIYEGDPAEEIVRHADRSGCDLICMTARRRAGWARFLGGGSVSREILRSARCPILIRRS
jgi:nucleotide-binding universal stress UspA family protein